MSDKKSDDAPQRPVGTLKGIIKSSTGKKTWHVTNIFFGGPNVEYIIDGNQK